ncbi:MAG: hypothetical protein IKA85_04820 [Clostridia bacterium]|nr:hypothetical protein [Clostridia bacterium]
MKLLKAYIENFGKISKTEYDFNSGLTTFCYENGYGKTTLATFIRAMFYSLPKVTTKSNFNDREHFYPFNGGKFGGNLTYEHEGDVYKIVRFFDKKSETKDEFTFYKNDNQITPPLENLGKFLFGVDESSFNRTLYFDKAFNSDLSGSDVTFKLTGIVENSEESFDNAKESLEIAQKKLKRTGKKGDLFDVADEIFKVNQEIESLKGVENSIQFKYKERAEIIAELEKAEDERKKVSELVVKKNNYGVYENYLKEAQNYKTELENLKKDYPNGLPIEKEIYNLNGLADNLSKLNGEIIANEITSDTLGEYNALKETFKKGVPSNNDIENIKNDINLINQKDKTSKGIKNYPLFLIGLLEVVVGIVLLFLNQVAGIMFLSVAVLFISGSFLIKGKVEDKPNDTELKVKAFLQSYNVNAENLLDGVYELKALIDKFDGLSKEIALKTTAIERAKTQILETEKTIIETFNKYGIILNRTESVKEQIRGIERDLFAISSKQNLYNNAVIKAENFKAEKGVTERVENVESYDEIELKCKELSQKLSTIDREIKNSEDMLESLPDKYNKLEILTEKQEKLKERYNDLTNALNYLLLAEETLKNKYINPVKDTFVNYAKDLEEVLGEKVIMDKNFMVYFEKSGENKSREYLSAGQSVLCDLCLRLALIDNMYKDNIPFIILDDPFITLDEKHLAKALELLKLLAKDKQIIYFTCHESRTI